MIACDVTSGKTGPHGLEAQLDELLKKYGTELCIYAGQATSLGCFFMQPDLFLHMHGHGLQGLDGHVRELLIM